MVKIGTIEKIDTNFSASKEIVPYIAKKILEYNSPYKLGLFLLESDKINKPEIDNIIKRLCKLESNESLWEKIFQKNFWKEKRCSLEAMMFVNMKYNRNDFKEKIKKYYLYPNKNNCASLLCIINTLDSTIKVANISLYNKINVLQKKIAFDSTSILNNMYEIDTLKNELRIDSLQKNIRKTDILIKTNKTTIVDLTKRII